jgi:hypothetical protein
VGRLSGRNITAVFEDGDWKTRDIKDMRPGQKIRVFTPRGHRFMTADGTEVFIAKGEPYKAFADWRIMTEQGIELTQVKA